MQNNEGRNVGKVDYLMAPTSIIDVWMVIVIGPMLSQFPRSHGGCVKRAVRESDNDNKYRSNE